MPEMDFKGLLRDILNVCFEIKHKINKLLEPRSSDNLMTKHDLKNMEDKIMSAISDYAAKVQASLDSINTSITSISTEITTLQNAQGAISPEDQTTLDNLATETAAAAEKLNALVPPVAPA